MKKMFALILALSLLFAACSSDNGDDDSIVGTWLMSSYHMTVDTNNDATTKAIIKSIGEDYEEQIGEYTVTFSKDGSVAIIYAGGGSDTGVYTINGDYLTMFLDYEGAEDDITTDKFLVSGNKLTMNDDRTEYAQDTYSSDESIIVTKVLTELTFARK